MNAATTIELPPLTGPQMEICAIDERPERCWDVEGSPRSAKSWGVGFWIWKLAYRYPGIQVFYARYKDEGLIQLRDIWSKVGAYFPPYLHPEWNTKDQCWDFPITGSRVFLSSLKVSEGADAAAVHGKYKGKTLAVVIIEEAQEVPQFNYMGLKERLSQSRTPEGTPFRYPLKIVLVHNAVDRGHWINDIFPLDESDRCNIEDHAHIRADLYSNAANLGDDVMRGYELDYPPGHPLRRTVIEGRRGTTVMGTPVYRGYFNRSVHVQPVEMDPQVPLLESWDFGHKHPCVVWQQMLPWGEKRTLGGVMGHNMFLEDFAPIALGYRQRWCPNPLEVWATCDPAGDAESNQGLSNKATDVLRACGVMVRPCIGGNHPNMRDTAIQRMGVLMRRRTDRGEAFTLNPRFVYLGDGKARNVEVIVEGLEAGYVWDDKALPFSAPNTRKPKKDGWYDHSMNCLEYLELMYGTSVPAATDVQKADAKALRSAQKDYDPYDRVRVRIQSRRGGF